MNASFIKFSSSLKFSSKYQLQLFVEFLTTFVLVFVIFLSEIHIGGFSIQMKTNTYSVNLAPLAVGFTIAPIIYTFGYLSGAHMNAAATFGFFLVKDISFQHAIGYVISQCLAATAGGALGIFISGICHPLQAAPEVAFDVHGPHGMLRSFLSEGIYTFAMMTVVFHVSVSMQKVNDFYGFAVALVVMSNIYAVGSVTGACMNPSIATGLILVKCLCGASCQPMLNLWIYWAAPCLGSFGAAVLYKMVHPKIMHPPRIEVVVASQEGGGSGFSMVKKNWSAATLDSLVPSNNNNSDKHQLPKSQSTNYLTVVNKNSIQHHNLTTASAVHAQALAEADERQRKKQNDDNVVQQSEEGVAECGESELKIPSSPLAMPGH